MAVRTVTVEMNLNATTFLADGRAVVTINHEMGDSFTRLARDSVAANTALNDTSRNVAQLGRRAARTERQVRDLRQEIDRLTAAALAATGPINIIQGQNGPGGQGGRGGGRGGGGGLFGIVRGFWSNLPAEGKAGIIAAALIIGTFFATALGAAVGAAMTLVLGGVVIAAMAALAIKTNDAVQHAFKGLGTKIFADAKGWSQAAVDPLILSAHDFGDTWTRIGPQVNEIFTLMAKSIRPLADGLGGFVESAMPGLRQALINAGPIIAQFAHDLPMVGESFGNMFENMSDGQGVLKGMHGLMLTLATVMDMLGATVNGLADAFDFLTRNGEAVTGFMQHIPVLGWLFGKIHDGLHSINATGEGAARSLDAVGDGADNAATAADRAAGRVTELDKAMAALNDQIEEDARGLIGLVDATIAYEQSVDDLTASIKDNGKNVDIHTQKGRDNVTAIENVAKAALAARDAFIVQNQAQMGMAGATQAANAAFKAQLDQLYLQMRGLGLADSAIQALLGDWYRLVAAPAAKLQVTTFYTQVGSAPAAARTTSGGGPLPRGNTRVFNRMGGLYARDGLLGESNMFRPGPTLYGFAEQGTGGEAFIARNADHGRSLAIANQAARWHGGQVVASGGAGAAPVVVIQPVLGGAGAADAAFAKMWDDMLYSGRLRAKVVNNRLAPV